MRLAAAVGPDAAAGAGGGAGEAPGQPPPPPGAVQRQSGLPLAGLHPLPGRPPKVRRARLGQLPAPHPGGPHRPAPARHRLHRRPPGHPPAPPGRGRLARPGGRPLAGHLPGLRGPRRVRPPGRLHLLRLPHPQGAGPDAAWPQQGPPPRPPPAQAHGRRRPAPRPPPGLRHRPGPVGRRPPVPPPYPPAAHPAGPHGPAVRRRLQDGRPGHPGRHRPGRRLLPGGPAPDRRNRPAVRRLAGRRPAGPGAAAPAAASGPRRPAGGVGPGLRVPPEPDRRGAGPPGALAGAGAGGAVGGPGGQPEAQAARALAAGGGPAGGGGGPGGGGPPRQALAGAVQAVLARHRVLGLLRVGWQRQEQARRRYQGPGRPGPGQAAQVEVQVRYHVSQVERDEAALVEQERRLGWRVQVTNLPSRRLGLVGCVLAYLEGWSLERDFHLLKDKPLGVSPLCVQAEEQVVGLTRLLTVGLRLLSLIEVASRQGLAQAREELAELYEGQPTRTTSRPTGVRLLRAVARLRLSLFGLPQGGEVRWHLNPLPPLLERVLRLLGLDPALYTRLATRDAQPRLPLKQLLLNSG